METLFQMFIYLCIYMLNNVFLNMDNASLSLQMYQKQDNQQNIL